ncbi:MAG: hypothetical protein JXR96_24535 [Deltaproteobacteria bacterium]|nr:hypothetical protein [Deltaproteobacteria bacterium]
MKSMTIHGLDEELAEKIREKAAAEKTSINKTIKKLLEQALGLRPREEGRHAAEFAEFCGVWSDEDRDEFDRAIADLEEIDESEWR